MTDTKKSHQNHGNHVKLSSNPTSHSKKSMPELSSHTTKAALPTHDVSSSRLITAAERQVPRPPKSAKSAGGGQSKVASKKSAQETPKHTRWTIDAASRVASASAKKGDGEVKRGSFAADAMSKAMKNARNIKEEK